MLCNKHQSNNKKEKLSLAERRRRDNRRPWISLKRYSESPFTFLFKSGNNQALLNCCAVDHTTRVFWNLLQLFEPVCNRYTVGKTTGAIWPVVLTKGRRQELDSIGCRALVLYWLQTQGSLSQATLCHSVLQQLLRTTGWDSLKRYFSLFYKIICLQKSESQQAKN